MTLCHERDRAFVIWSRQFAAKCLGEILIDFERFDPRVNDTNPVTFKPTEKQYRASLFMSEDEGAIFDVVAIAIRNCGSGPPEVSQRICVDLTAFSRSKTIVITLENLRQRRFSQLCRSRNCDDN